MRAPRTRPNAQTMAVVLTSFFLPLIPALSAPKSPSASFHKEVQPLLTKYCYDCHGDGMSKGGVAFDEVKDAELTAKPELWSKALRNVRAGLMPPEKKPHPSEAERAVLERWIKYDGLGIDSANPDPGRVTVRRLNRVEYANTIHDLMGVDFKADDEFPADDSGYGFDNIGDVLTLSPLLLEKYMQAAEAIVAAAVPTVARVVAPPPFPRAPGAVPWRSIPGSEFKAADGATGERMSLYKPATVSKNFTASKA